MIWTVENGKARKSDEVEYAQNFKAVEDLMKEGMYLILCTVAVCIFGGACHKVADFPCRSRSLLYLCSKSTKLADHYTSSLFTAPKSNIASPINFPYYNVM